MSEVPANVEEFSKIAGLIFAQLYEAFPVTVNIDSDAVAEAMGVKGKDWFAHKLASGRSFGEVFGCTIAWLASEDYIRSGGSHPAAHVILTTRGLQAMNAIGTALVQAAGKDTRDLTRVGSLLGGILGGAYKTIASG